MPIAHRNQIGHERRALRCLQARRESFNEIPEFVLERGAVSRMRGSNRAKDDKLIKYTSVCYQVGFGLVINEILCSFDDREEF